LSRSQDAAQALTAAISRGIATIMQILQIKREYVVHHLHH